MKEYKNTRLQEKQEYRIQKKTKQEYKKTRDKNTENKNTKKQEYKKTRNKISMYKKTRHKDDTRLLVQIDDYAFGKKKWNCFSVAGCMKQHIVNTRYYYV